MQNKTSGYFSLDEGEASAGPASRSTWQAVLSPWIEEVLSNSVCYQELVRALAETLFQMTRRESQNYDIEGGLRSSGMSGVLNQAV